MAADIRYDRQIRLWGEEGQASIQNTKVCVFGSSSLATETLKNLVLPGIHSFHIVDDAVVDVTDLGQNFFITSSDIGKSRAEVVTKYLRELNPSVQGSYSDASPLKLSPLQDLLRFSIIISTNLTTSELLPIGNFLYDHNVPLINTRVCGLFGYLRLSFKYHTIHNRHPEHPSPDFRLDLPFASLLEMEAANDLSTMSHQDHSHTPYLLLIMKALNLWRQSIGDLNAFPETYKHRKEIERILMDMRMPNDKGILDEENFDEAKTALLRALSKTTIPSNVKDVFSHEYCRIENLTEKSAKMFWVLSAALKIFVEKHNCLPVSGQLPDMLSDSKRYAQLLSLYRERAEQDAKEVFATALDILKGIFDDDNLLTYPQCQRFCKLAAHIGIQTGTSLANEAGIDVILTKIKECQAIDPSKDVVPLTWLALTRAVDDFYNGKRRYPGTNGVPRSLDAEDLARRLEHLVAETNDEEIKKDLKTLIPQKALDEICRYGASEPHVISAIMGGVVSQEAIKLATHQYVPVNNTFIYEGYTQAGETIRL